MKKESYRPVGEIEFAHLVRRKEWIVSILSCRRCRFSHCCWTEEERKLVFSSLFQEIAWREVRFNGGWTEKNGRFHGALGFEKSTWFSCGKYWTWIHYWLILLDKSLNQLLMPYGWGKTIQNILNMDSWFTCGLVIQIIYFLTLTFIFLFYSCYHIYQIGII